MATQTTEATPSLLPTSQKHVPVTPDGFATRRSLMIRHGITLDAFGVLVNRFSVRVRHLPGERHPKYHGEDVERAVRESITVGSPPQPASA